MHELIPDMLWTGNANDARDARATLAAGIAAVIDLAYEEPAAQLPRSLVYCRFPLIDGAGNDSRLLCLAVDVVVRLLSAGTPTLVACGAGMSRAPMIAVAALSLHRGQTPDVVLQSIAASGPHDLSPALWDEVLTACGLDK